MNAIIFQNYHKDFKSYNYSDNTHLNDHIIYLWPKIYLTSGQFTYQNTWLKGYVFSMWL